MERTRTIKGIVREMTDGFETFGYSIGDTNLNYELQELELKYVVITIQEVNDSEEE